MSFPNELINRFDSLLARVENGEYELSPADVLVISGLRGRYVVLFDQIVAAQNALRNSKDAQRGLRELHDHMVVVLENTRNRTRNQAVGGAVGFGVSAGVSLFLGLNLPTAIAAIGVCTVTGVWVGGKVPTGQE